MYYVQAVHSLMHRVLQVPLLMLPTKKDSAQRGCVIMRPISYLGDRLEIPSKPLGHLDPLLYPRVCLNKMNVC